jgi:uncharacterized protein
MEAADFKEDMPTRLKHLKQRAKSDRKTNKKYFKKLRRRSPKALDATVARLHDEVFEDTECLHCANCCKTASPIFHKRDIERIAKHLQMRPAAFVERYLRVDEEGDYIPNALPCPFLGDDNRCRIYEQRPKACREYPHTNHKNFHQVLDLTLKNTSVCPAALEVVRRLREALPL